VQLLSRFGANKVSEVKETDYTALLTDIGKHMEGDTA
jgi:hypothetical protein